MSIPLDRLYHYINNLISDDIIIYRWQPHGSKKLEDLEVFVDSDKNDPFERMLVNNLILHDQEPLDYDLYSHQDFLKQAILRANERIRLEQEGKAPRLSWYRSEQFLNIFAKSHLRVMSSYPINLRDCMLLCHSEKNSTDLRMYESNGFIGVYYWSHALIARDWFRYAEHDTIKLDVNKIKNTFLIYNRAWSGTREYRLKFVETLIDQNLISDCNIKFNPIDSDEHYTYHKFSNDELSIVRRDLENLLPLNTASSNASADYVGEDYSEAGIEVVLETLFDDQRQHLTEKTLRPIAVGRPFILAATPHSLKYLRDYGFKTFDGLINEEYDTIEHPVARLNAITTEMGRISSLPADQKATLFRNLQAIANYNKERFFSKEFQDSITSEFIENFNKALVLSDQRTTGKWANAFMHPSVTGAVTEKSNLYYRVVEWLKENGKFDNHDWDF